VGPSLQSGTCARKCVTLSLGLETLTGEVLGGDNDLPEGKLLVESRCAKSLEEWPLELFLIEDPTEILEESTLDGASLEGLCTSVKAVRGGGCSSRRLEEFEASASSSRGSKSLEDLLLTVEASTDFLLMLEKR